MIDTTSLHTIFFYVCLFSLVSVIAFYQHQQEIKFDKHLFQHSDIRSDQSKTDHPKLKDPIYKNCLTLLHDGQHKNVTYDPNFPLNQHYFPRNDTENVKLSLAGWGIYFWQGPKTCGYKIYQLDEVKTCLAEHYSNIEILGDSCLLACFRCWRIRPKFYPL